MTVTMLPTSGIEETILLSDLVDLEQAGFEDGGQAMREIDEEHVRLLANTPGQELPAIIAVRVAINGMARYAVVDGYHRWHAAEERGDTTIKVVARYYEHENAVIMDAFEANFTHGLKASKQTRTDYALWIWLQDENDKFSMRDIAKMAGLNVSNVSRAIKKYQEENDTSEEANYRAEATATKKMLSALHKFYNDERTFFGKFQRGDGPREVEHRAKAIYKYIASQPKEKHPQIVQELRCLNETLDAFLVMLNKPTGVK